MGKHLAVLGLLSLLAVGIAAGIPLADSGNGSGTVANYPYINQMILESSRYTQTEEDDPTVLANYHDNYTLFYTPEELETLGFDLMFDTPELSVWFETDSFSLMVQNKTTGYFWSSRPEFQGMSGTREDNKANRNLMNSGIWIDYLPLASITSSKITTDSLYSLAEVEYATNGAITPENPDHLRPYLLDEGTYDYSKVTAAITAQTETAFTIHVDLKVLGIAFDVEIRLIDGDLEVTVLSDSITETLEKYALMGLSVFPYFGSAREDEMPGYIVIPDGVGALVRTNQRYNTYFQASFYGDDFGYDAYDVAHLSVPIFGIVHEAEANGFYANILEGSEYSTLISYFWGDKTRYDRIYSRFNYREIYWTVINKAGDGNETIAEGLRDVDFRQSYTFLSGDEATYVGMAADYGDELREEGILSDRETVVEGQIPIQLSYIMSDREPAFIGTSKVTMTTISQVSEAYDDFSDLGLKNQQIVLLGWSRDGFVNRAPYTVSVSGKAAYQSLAEKVIADGNAVYLNDDYVAGSEWSTRISYNRDVAKDLSRLKIVFDDVTLDGQSTQIQILYPDRSLAFAAADAEAFSRLGVSGLALDSLGSTLFSYYDGEIHERGETLATYRELASLADGLLLHDPNAYLFQFLDGYLDMPITNSQYDYYTDLVPLLPIILKGSISYYTGYLNFNALAEDRLLMMVDFGVNPSYVLTYEETYKMRYTAASAYYTTTLSDYEAEIVETYEYLNGALGHVVGESILHREVLQTGLVRIDYENGVSIYVNYNYEPVTLGTVSVPARDYEVILP